MKSKENTKNILLSIIIPVYNVEKHLERCYESIRGDFASLPYEIIFVNDGSTDKSLEVLNKIVPKSEFVKIITQENKGLSGARNTGIDIAKGEYLVFLDSDDWLNFDIIKELLYYALDENLELISYNLEYFNEDNNSMGLRMEHPLKYNIVLDGEQVLTQGYQPSSSCLFIYNKSFLNTYNLRFHPRIAQQDVEFTLRIMLYAKKVYFSNKVGYNYFRNHGTISLPTTIDKLKKYLSDSIIVADLMKKNCLTVQNNNKKLICVIQKNYNSVVWNLIWRFYSKPKEVDYDFKVKCLKELKEKELYPIKGALKTNFQKISCFFFNQEWLLKLVFKFKS